jgi:hypothetical protein
MKTAVSGVLRTFTSDGDVLVTDTLELPPEMVAVWLGLEMAEGLAVRVGITTTAVLAEAPDTEADTEAALDVDVVVGLLVTVGLAGEPFPESNPTPLSLAEAADPRTMTSRAGKKRAKKARMMGALGSKGPQSTGRRSF